MNSIYLDNAATTPMLPEVIEVMQKSMQENFGNPSSTHKFGRKAKAAVETARKNIAKHFNITASEIIFTAGGTEADNLILHNAVTGLGVKTIITSRIEHHAVLHTVQFLEKEYNIKVLYVDVDYRGGIVLEDLENKLAQETDKVLVSLMWVNNEIGNLLSIERVSELCKKHNALFHSDTVQGIGHYNLDLQKIPVDFIAASAHKFHGPKGVGFAIVKKEYPVKPMFHGGAQEKGARSSTENVHAILGMEKALSIAYQNLEKDTIYIKDVKKYLLDSFKEISNEIAFNGCSDDLEKSSYTILNVRFPVEDKMLLFNLDLQGISVSGGSACQSGSSKGSHVLQSFLNDDEAKKSSVRFSFSVLTSKKEVEIVVEKLKTYFKRF
ncbi:cysteine desulfurase [Tenacibaculum holothuriorum]|uniref:cysteine desulfurase n=1 Tax=Tenacibaculum holothuriorum TaxID=1635173 RepID=A0A1Y2PBN1_9FLAO|nr:cysteine desulfurase family protein [Tenacibaculum holothuriorum]OSY87873.1 cysteine desulfurase [Tenacibaculum holothuriorum]